MSSGSSALWMLISWQQGSYWHNKPLSWIFTAEDLKFIISILIKFPSLRSLIAFALNSFKIHKTSWRTKHFLVKPPRHRVVLSPAALFNCCRLGRLVCGCELKVELDSVYYLKSLSARTEFAVFMRTTKFFLFRTGRQTFSGTGLLLFVCCAGKKRFCSRNPAMIKAFE